MQRIVIESGRLHASMRFHIDTHSAAADDRGSTFDFRNTINASGSLSFGPWGASASMTNTIGYVSTQRTQTTEEMNTDLDLNSSVELNFKTDYLPLDRLAGREQTDRIRANTLNPEAEARAAAEARTARGQRHAEAGRNRRTSLERALVPSQPPAPEAPSVPAPAAEQPAQEQPAASNPAPAGGSPPGQAAHPAPVQESQTGGNSAPPVTTHAA
jgi:hypothetical protein